MRGGGWLVLALVGCGGFTAGSGEPQAGAGVTVGSGGAAGAQAAATGQGGAAPASSSSMAASGSATAAASSTASSSASGSTSSSTSSASSSASASSSGAGGAPPECEGKPKGTQCLSTCLCPMPKCYPPNDNNTCTAGLCDGKGACVQFIPVRCKIGNTIYTACNGGGNAPWIFFNGAASTCIDSGQVGYCAPGVDCSVSVGGVNKGSGVCI